MGMHAGQHTPRAVARATLATTLRAIRGSRMSRRAISDQRSAISDQRSAISDQRSAAGGLSAAR
jgi:hypothetical protein